MNKRSATAPIKPDSVWLKGGLDLISPPGYAAPGTCRFSLNYEAVFGGGYRRTGGIERFDGQAMPSKALFYVIEASSGFTGVVVGNTLTGAVSGASGQVIYVTATKIAVTRLSGGSFGLEAVKVGLTTVGIVTSTTPAIDSFLDNTLASLAADNYRSAISMPPGSGPIRGVAILNETVYCWRDFATELRTYKSTTAGWVLVTHFSQVGFTAGTVLYPEGSTISIAGNTAIIKRVVLESGSWSAGTAAGRFIVSPQTGALTAGVAGGGGAATLTGAPAQIAMVSGGRVETVVSNFTASPSTRRLYGCDGVNAEWEFDGTVLVPLNTSMPSIRATHVIAHKNHLVYAYQSSVLYSAVGDPYKWSAILGAGELGTGDTVTNLINTSGSELSSALLVLCKNSAWALYGIDDVNMRFNHLAEEAGAQAYSAQSMGGAMSFDHESFYRFTATQMFGNFQYESISLKIAPMVRGKTVACSVLAKNKSTYRCFFTDGMFVTGTPSGDSISWMASDYGVIVNCCTSGEIGGQYRIFVGDSNGWVFETDVGRSFDGQQIQAGIRFSSQNQGSNILIKQYRYAELEIQSESSFTLASAAEFSDSDPALASVDTTAMTNFIRQYGAGLLWDFNAWDRAYLDVSMINRTRYPIYGQGRSVSMLVQSASNSELPHTIKSMTITYTPRRLAR